MIDYRLGDRAAIAVCVLLGARGVGKSSLAAAWARRAAEHDWPVVAWFDAQDSADMLVSFSLLAEHLGIALHKEPEASAHSALDWLRATQQRCLLVFDNAVDPDAVRRWIPATGNVSVLITTNETGFAVLSTAAPIQVDVFTSAQAVTYLQQRTGGGVDGAAELADDLGRLPLALAQAAPTIIDDLREGRSYAGYRRRMSSVPLRDLLGPVRGDAYPLGYAQAVMLSVEHVEQGVPDVAVVRRVLDAVALLSGDAIPTDLLRAVADADAVDRIVHQLVSISLLNLAGTAAVGMHHLTQQILLGRARRLRTLPASLADLVAAFESTEPEAGDAWPRRELLRQRARLLAQLRRQPEAAEAAAPDLHARLLRAQAREMALLNDASEYSLVLAQGPLVVSELTDAAGADDPAVLSARHSLGEAYSRAWREPEAAAVLTAVLDARVRVLGPEHPDTLATKASLAKVHMLAGRIAAAADLMTDVVVARRAALGDRDRQTLAARADLASIKTAGGSLDEAIELFEHVYRERVAALGEDDPHTIETRTSLVFARWRTGDIEQATVLAEHVLADRRRAQGADHPDTLNARLSLVGLYRSDGRVTEAVLMMEEAAQAYRRVYGDEHADTVLAQIFLADAYEAAGRDGDALALNERTLPSARAALGEHHYLVQSCVNRLASAYLRRGAYQEAIALHTGVLDEQRAQNSDDDLKTVHSRAVLAGALQQSGRVGEAVEMLESVAADRARILGPDHSDTLAARTALADALLQAEDHDEAVAMHEDVVAARRRLQGDDHPDTLESRAALAHAYRRTWRLEAAVAAWEQLAADWRRLRGPEHTAAIGAQAGLAHAYTMVGRREDAATVLEQVLQARVRLLGDDHPSTLTTMGELARALTSTGRRNRVIPLLAAAAAGFARVAGRTHVDTFAARRDLADAYIAIGETERGLALHAQALDDVRQGVSKTPLTVGLLEGSMSVARLAAGRLPEAVSELERAIQAAERELGADHHLTLALRDAIAGTHLDNGDATTAIRLYETTLARRKSLYGETHNRVLENEFQLGRAFIAAGRNKDAAAIYTELIGKVTASRAKRAGTDAAILLASLSKELASALLSEGDYEQAARVAARSVADARRALGADNRLVFNGRGLHAAALAAAGRLDEATTEYERLIADLGSAYNGGKLEAAAHQVQLAWVHHKAGRPERCMALLVELIAAFSHELGERHPQTLRVRSLYAQALGYHAVDGDVLDDQLYDEAVGLLRAVNADQRETLGPDHPDILDSRYALQLLYRNAKREVEALAVLEDLVADQRRVRGETHPLTLQTRGELADALFAADRHPEAIALQELLVADEQRLLTVGDETLLMHRALLTKMYSMAGRYVEAHALGAAIKAELEGSRHLDMWIAILEEIDVIELNERLLKEDPTDEDIAQLTERYGSDDVTMLRLRFRAAVAHGKAGDTARATADLDQIVIDTTRVLGPDHAETRAARIHPADWRAAAGDPAAAATALEELLTDARRALGDDHPHVLAVRVDLARRRGEAGDPAAAAAALTELMPAARGTWGPDQPDTIAAVEQLARWRGEAGDPAGAIAVASDVFSRRLLSLGPDHPATLSVRTMMMRWQGEAGDPAGALTSAESLLADLTRVLGPTHLYTATARVIRARWLHATGDPAGAAAELADLIPLYIDMYGDGDELWSVEYNAVLWYLESGNGERALSIGADLLASKHRALGPRHWDTLSTRGDLAAWRGEAGDPARAAAELTQLLPDLTDTLGPDDETTLYFRGVQARWQGETGDVAGAIIAFSALLPELERVLGPEYDLTRETVALLTSLRQRADPAAPAAPTDSEMG